jgi:hypothetical protein
MAGRATLTTEESMKPRLEPRMVVGRTQRVLALAAG